MSNIANNLFDDLRTKKTDPPGTQEKKRNLILEQSMGLHGCEYISGVGQRDGPFCSIQACEATVIATAIGEGISLSGVPLAAGQTVPGNFTSITLTSGSILAFKSVSAIG